MDLLSQEPLLSTDEVTKGFDLEAGRRWIYPENYPLRQYQFTIAKTALFHNTLVCLPTGLGKTFIAAVVMYNYFRWYPKGIIVFLAPTKPLVGQQINACHDIMGIPVSQTIELTGATNQKKRHQLWREKRVIFATPQTFQKDLEHNIVPTDHIKCIVIDEAHKALGKHSYCESIRMMRDRNEYFRLVALSATPGGKVEAVQDVIRNLHITHLELRDDTSPDILPYINERKFDIIVVGLGQDLYKFKERYIEIMDVHVKVLIQCHGIRGGCTANISKGRIFHILREFQPKKNSANYGIIMKTLNILLTMYHAYELIVRHGLRAFYNFYQNHSDKPWLDNELKLQELLEDIKQYIGPFPDVRSIIDKTITEIPKDIVFGHDKFKKLQDILIQHFRKSASSPLVNDKENNSSNNNNINNNTRAIVFVEFRDIVNEVFVLLLQSSPLIRPQIFVGQAGLKQKAQKKALEDFRNNHVNVLISTSVGEEGLDVGEVDLIICFDISQQSPTRLVQRMGRTGRKRDGHIIFLVTDGKERETLQSALVRRDSLNNKVLHSSDVITAAQQEISPRMIPEDITPECQKIHMTIIPKISNVQRKKLTTTGAARSLQSKEKNKKQQKGSSEELVVSKKNIQKGSLVKFLTTVSNEDNNHTASATATADNDDYVDNDMTSPIIQSTKLIEHGHVISHQSINSKSSINYNAIKPYEVKLLTNDQETLEFLTFCATRQSERDNRSSKINDDNMLLKIPYVFNYCTDDETAVFSFNDLKNPDYSILCCIDKLEKFIDPMEKEKEDAECHIMDGSMINNALSSRGKSSYNYHEQCCSSFERYDENKFEDFLNSSGSELESEQNVAIVGDSPLLESVDWTNHMTSGSLLKNKESQCGNTFSNHFVDDILNNSSDNDDDEPVNGIKEKPVFRTPENRQNEGEVGKSAFECILDEASDNDDSTVLTQSNNYDEDIYYVSQEKDIGIVAEKKENTSLNGLTLNGEMPSPSTSDNEVDMKVDKILNIENKSHDDYSIDMKEYTNDISSDQRIVESLLNTTMNEVNVIECQTISSNENAISQKKEETEKGNTENEIQQIDHLYDKRNSIDNNQIVSSSIVDKDHTIHRNNRKSASTVNCEPTSSSIINSTNSMSENIINIDDNNIDDFDWSSDFETTRFDHPITESKYFKKSTLKSTPVVKVVTAKLPEKSTTNKKPMEKDKLTTIRNTLFTKPKKKFTIYNVSSSDSDDDFSTRKIEKTVFNGLQSNVKRGINAVSTITTTTTDKRSDNKEISSSKNKGNSSAGNNYTALDKKEKSSHSLMNIRRRKFTRKKGGKRKLKNDLIDDEAQVSSDDSHSNENSENDEENDDEDLEDFVSYTQYQDDSVDMKGYYLQSTRSPQKINGFHIKKPAAGRVPNEEIYSQIVHNEEADSYLYDSFCVRESEEEDENNISSGEITILHEVGPNLNRKRKRNNFQRSRKRKRILLTSSNKTSGGGSDDDSSSEDETEKMRIAIMNTSIMTQK